MIHNVLSSFKLVTLPVHRNGPASEATTVVTQHVIVATAPFLTFEQRAL